jgi:alkylation response protein AidB-like acyl-CoA dehydrogenase
MDFSFTLEEEAFREEFTSWLNQNLPENWNPLQYTVFESQEEWGRLYRGFQNKLFRAGYAGLHYPPEFGGRGKTLIQELIVSETIASTCLELKIPGVVTHGMAAPLLFLCGREDQKKEFLPKIFDGTHIWCQGFSEPNAGSDVVNVGTRALKQNGTYIVNGQKVWTSFAHLADYGLLLVRTDSQGPKHKGLTYLLLDMKLPGVEVRPVRQITGEAEFNEIFLDDVRIPEAMRVGQEGDGWRIAISTLMFERAMGDAVMAGAYLRNIRSLMDLARQMKRSGRPVLEDPVFRQQIGQAYIRVMAVKMHGYRSLCHLLRGNVPGPEGSIGKILWSETNQRLCETALQIQGPFSQLTKGSPWAVRDGMWQYLFLKSKGSTIAAGTTEVLRNVIGERILGLPKDASRVTRT